MCVLGYACVCCLASSATSELLILSLSELQKVFPSHLLFKSFISQCETHFKQCIPGKGNSFQNFKSLLQAMGIRTSAESSEVLNDSANTALFSNTSLWVFISFVHQAQVTRVLERKQGFLSPCGFLSPRFSPCDLFWVVGFYRLRFLLDFSWHASAHQRVLPYQGVNFQVCQL